MSLPSHLWQSLYDDQSLWKRVKIAFIICLLTNETNGRLMLKCKGGRGANGSENKDRACHGITSVL